MRACLSFSVLALLVGSVTATLAQNENYSVDGLQLGSRVRFDSATYREYKCSPSDQFDRFTWCQKTGSDKERRGTFTANYSLLHSHEGKVVYINRSQEPAFFDRNEVEEDIQRYTRKIGESPRITKIPHRAGLPDATIALWGKTTLDQLDQDSIKALADGKSPKKGLLIDFLGNFARSAKEGLPIYRIGGGAGFIWAASVNDKGRGILRFAAVNALELSPSYAEPTPIISQSPPPAQNRIEGEAELPELKQQIERLKADLAISTAKIAELEEAKAGADRAVKQAEQARLDAENYNRDIAQMKVPDKTEFDAVIAQLEADKTAADTKARNWARFGYAVIIGLLAVVAFFGINLQKIVAPQKPQGEQPGTNPADTSVQSQVTEAERETETLSHVAVVSEDAIGLELQKLVANINETATQSASTDADSQSPEVSVAAPNI